MHEIVFLHIYYPSATITFSDITSSQYLFSKYIQIIVILILNLFNFSPIGSEIVA